MGNAGSLLYVDAAPPLSIPWHEVAVGIGAIRTKMEGLLSSRRPDKLQLGHPREFEPEVDPVADAAMPQGFARSKPEGLPAEGFCAKLKDS
jgi:hypothetical protein